MTGSPGCKYGGRQGEGGDMEGNRLPSDFQQSAQAEEEIDDMGHGKADKVTGNTVSGQQKVKK